MLKRQKEVVLYQLGEEEKVIKQLERQYRKALEDVEMVIRILMTDEQTPSKINRINYQKRLQTQLEGVLEALHTNQYKTINAFLQDSYTDSFVGAVYDMHGQRVPLILPVDQNAAVKAIQLDTKLSERKIHPNMNGEHVTLYESLGVDIDHLKKAIRQEITRGIATGMEIKDIARNISLRTKAPLSRAKTIARTESHRIQESSKQDARTAAREKGADVVKKWDSTMDGDTRPDHRALDGQIREVDEPFEIHGKRAMNPGGFGKPGDDCNCRCLGLTIARWLLGEEDLERMQEKAKYWDLDKTRDFADFKKKYLKASETLEKSGESGIIKARNITQRTMANGMRTSPFHILTQPEIDSIYEDADSIGVPRTLLRFNEKSQTGFYDDEGLIFIRGDILPDLQSKNVRDILTQKAVLAHEYYGHYLSHPSPFRIGDWRDEFMASYKAALNAPNLSDNERRMLMLDAYDRAKEAGVPVIYNKEARRLIHGYE